MSTSTELSLRDCGTQLKEKYLQPYLQNFTVASKELSAILEDRVYKSSCTQEGAQKKNKCIQTGRFGPMGRKEIVKCQSIKYPSTKVLEGIAKKRSLPQMASCEVLKSRFKSGFCRWLLNEIKNPNTEDPRFKRLGDQVYTKVYGPEFKPIQ